MIDRGHELPLSRQAAVLGISRGSLYYSACPLPAAELAIMRRIDELHLDYPFAGSRMLRRLPGWTCAAAIYRRSPSDASSS